MPENDQTCWSVVSSERLIFYSDFVVSWEGGKEMLSITGVMLQRLEANEASNKHLLLGIEATNMLFGKVYK